MSEKSFVLKVEVSCEENLGEMYAGLTLQTAVARPGGGLAVCLVTFPAVGRTSGRDAIIDGLAPYFNARFWRDRVTGVDYLARLADDLLAFNFKGKDFARIALMLYDSPSMINKPNAFNVWYRMFCEVVGCRYVESYHPHNIGSYEKLRKMFYYVEEQ